MPANQRTVLSALGYIKQQINESEWVSNRTGLCRAHSKWAEVALSEKPVLPIPNYRSTESLYVGWLPVSGSSCVSLLAITTIPCAVAHSPLACSGPEFLSSCRTDGRLLVFIHRPARRYPGLWILHPDHVSSYTARACEHTVDDLRQFWGRGQHHRESERGETLQKISCQNQGAEQTLWLNRKTFTSKKRLGKTPCLLTTL